MFNKIKKLLADVNKTYTFTVDFFSINNFLSCRPTKTLLGT